MKPGHTIDLPVDRGRPPEVGHLPAAALMTRHFLSVTPDLSLESVALALLDADAGGAPVVNADGTLLGFISMTDIVREWNAGGDTQEDAWTLRQLLRRRNDGELQVGYHVEVLARATVEQVMVRRVIALPEHASVARAASIMAFENVHQIPILSRTGTVLGMLRSIDILRRLAETDGFLVPLRERGGNPT